MEKRKRSSFFALFSFAAAMALSLFLLPGGEVCAQEQTGYSTASDLNMRKKASTSSSVLKKFQPGDSMTVLGTTGDWYKVESDNMTGYVYQSYVTLSQTAFCKGDQVNFRKKANTSSAVLGTFYKGDTMTVLSKSGSWYKVKADGKTGYIHGDYVTFQYTAYVNGSRVNLRAKASTSSSVLATLDKAEKLTYLGKEGSWCKVRYGSKTGYIKEDYVTFTKPSVKVTGQDIVNYAKKFLGNPYVYGGNSLTNGIDCSGFTKEIYKHFGYTLPRTSKEQRSAGTKVSSLSKAQAGDLICYEGHVAIYMGNNKIIHASNPKDGIKISNNAAYTTILAIRRIL